MTPPDTPPPIVASSVDLPHGSVFEPHIHQESQLVYASQGVMTVSTAIGNWVLPPQRAAWIPANTEHSVSCSGEVKVRTLFFRKHISPLLPQGCCILSVSDLMREVIVRIAQTWEEFPLTEQDKRLLAVLLDEIQSTATAPLYLPLPQDKRLQQLTRKLQRNPADKRSLPQWSKEIGASTRTIERLFQRETGMSYREWLRQLRLLNALERLATGTSVDAVAYSLGYESTSAFIAMFRHSLGTTPGRYFNDNPNAK